MRTRTAVPSWARLLVAMGVVGWAAHGCSSSSETTSPVTTTAPQGGGGTGAAGATGGTGGTTAGGGGGGGGGSSPGGCTGGLTCQAVGFDYECADSNLNPAPGAAACSNSIFCALGYACFLDPGSTTSGTTSSHCYQDCSPGPMTCDTCMTTADTLGGCATESSACTADTTCAACISNSSVSGCSTDQAYVSVSDCACGAGACGESCSIGCRYHGDGCCGGDSGISFCVTCLSQPDASGGCATESSACNNSTACQTLITCLKNSWSAAQVTACETTAGTTATNEYHALRYCACSNPNTCGGACDC